MALIEVTVMSKVWSDPLIKQPKVVLPSPQIMVIRMGEIVEACPPTGPPPCLGAFCACAGGGFTRAGISLYPPTCEAFPEPCSNSTDLCKQCFSESGCAGGSKTGGRRVLMTCERTCERTCVIPDIRCQLGDHRPRKS